MGEEGLGEGHVGLQDGDLHHPHEQHVRLEDVGTGGNEALGGEQVQVGAGRGSRTQNRVRPCTGVPPLGPAGSPLTFTSILWDDGGRWAATNQSPGAGWEMFTEALLCSILSRKEGFTEVPSGKLVPSGLMTGGAP